MRLLRSKLMAGHRDIGAFNRRAEAYDNGVVGRFHRELADRVIALADDHAPPRPRILDVGCGTGLALSLWRTRRPDAAILAGIDPAEEMIRVAANQCVGAGARFARAAAEQLPFQGGSFDLVLATATFDHWSHQPAGLCECRRVLKPGGRLIVTDLFGLVLLPTLPFRRAHARTRGRMTRLLTDAGLHVEAWHRTHAPVIQTVIARDHSS